MAHRVGDRIRERSTTTGTGSYTLAGAFAGFSTMASVLTVDVDTAFFFASDGTDWEVFLGTRTSATVLARTTVYASSNGGSLVNWGSGTKEVTGSVPARFAELLNTIEISLSSSTTPGTVDIGAAQGMVVLITGTTTITSFGTATNKVRLVRFAASLTLTRNATTLNTPGNVNITTAANDCAWCVSDGSGNWRVYFYQRAATAV
jgi:hypothetical protein